MLSTLRTLSASRPVVEVGWIDAAHSPEDSAMDAKELGGLTPLISVGYLVRATKEFIVLATDKCPEDGSMRSSLTIPLGWVIFVKTPDTLLRGRRFPAFSADFADAIQIESTDESLPRKGRPRRNQAERGAGIRPSNPLPPGPTGASPAEAEAQTTE